MKAKPLISVTSESDDFTCTVVIKVEKGSGKLHVRGKKIVNLTPKKLKFETPSAPVHGKPYWAPYVENAEQYRRQPGDLEGVPLRATPSKLNVAGMRKVWELHQEGWNCRQISDALGGIIDMEAVRRLLRKITLAKGVK